VYNLIIEVEKKISKKPIRIDFDSN
jgi:hypothetical protein